MCAYRFALIVFAVLFALVAAQPAPATVLESKSADEQKLTQTVAKAQSTVKQTADVVKTSVQREENKHVDDYNHALDDATSAVHEVEGAREGLNHGAVDEKAIAARAADVEEHVTAPLKEKRGLLLKKAAELEQTVSSLVSEKATSADCKKAEEKIGELQINQDKLNKVDAEINAALKQGMQDEAEHASQNAREVDNRVRKLARVARKKTDHLDDLERKLGKPETADALQDRAESAAVQVENKVSSLARLTQESSERQVRQAKHAARTAAEARDEAIREMQATVSRARARLSAGEKAPLALSQESGDASASLSVAAGCFASVLIVVAAGLWITGRLRRGSTEHTEPLLA